MEMAVIKLQTVHDDDEPMDELQPGSERETGEEYKTKREQEEGESDGDKNESIVGIWHGCGIGYIPDD